MSVQFEFTLDRNHQTFQKISNPHSHDSVEIMLCLSNGGIFYLNEQLIPLHRGNLIVVQGKTPHHCIVDISSFDRYSLRTPYETLREISSLQTDFKVILGNATQSVILSEEQTVTLTDLMNRCLDCGSFFGEDLLRSLYFLQIILSIGQLLRIAPRRTPSLSKEYQRVLPAIQYIHEHYAEEISVDQLSRICFVSKYYLSHLFKEVTGFSIKSYIINYRVLQSCTLLSQGYSVQNAGEAVGFCNSAHFIQTFGRLIGMTPGKYVKKH